VRYGKGCNPSDLWVSYFTSSVYVEEFRKENGEPDLIQVRRSFSSILSAREWEDKVLNRLNCIKSDKWLNKGNGGKTSSSKNSQIKPKQRCLKLNLVENNQKKKRKLEVLI